MPGLLRVLVVAMLCASYPAPLAAAQPTTRPAARSDINFTITPARTGLQMVRASLPLPRGAAAPDASMAVFRNAEQIPACWRPLTSYPAGPDGGQSVRRGLVTFPYSFTSREPVTFRLAPRPSVAAAQPLPVTVKLEVGVVHIAYEGGPSLRAKVIAPPAASPVEPTVETVESSEHYLWQRYRFADPQWPRVIEVRVDALGTAALVAHLQRNLPGDDFAPEFGWELTTSGPGRLVTEDAATTGAPGAVRHAFSTGKRASLLLVNDAYRVYHPSAHLKQRGHLELGPGADDELAYRYLRCTPDEQVPMQQAAWRRAELVISPADQAELSPTLTSPHRVVVEPGVWDEVYGSGHPLAPGESELTDLAAYHREAIVRSAAIGDDWGNITSFDDRDPAGAVYGMNRLNHCPPIFMEGYRSGDRRLVEAGLAWCDNFYDLSIWWGPEKTGGTRYNNAARSGKTPPGDPKKFMWRSNNSVHFCTKGYDSFLVAYEETGDPRMKQALDAQVAYASEYVHADQGECRNIGDVRDFLRLYEWTGDRRHLENALRLFRELRTKLSPGDLFSQGGQQIVPDPPFIEEDKKGTEHPFAKPYIIGYALAGLPDLGRYAPEEPKLRDVVRAVADFMAESQDPVGGWRYPHPRSSGLTLGQAMEHANQVMEAAELIGPEERYLDAIERVLRQRVHGWLRSGRLLSGLNGWELATKRVKDSLELYDLYKRPSDRDPSRDYTEGAVGLGSSPPEGLVYFFEVLRYYLAHRPAARLLAAPADDHPLGQVLQRVSPRTRHQTRGVRNLLPAFTESVRERLSYPLSWLSGNYENFDSWKSEARKQVMRLLLAPPPAVPFDPVIVGTQDRGSYVAAKVVFNLTGDSRVLGFLLTPKGTGPFPAVLLLHDHGAKFDIGKEKVVETWSDVSERPASARAWVDRYYGGRFIGDELARRGYVCFVTDALNWSDRGGAGYEGQQALACNLFNLGMSLAGCIAHEDLRAAEFLASRPEVDPARIAAMGLSMGAFRTWQVAALSDHISAGVAICWMATNKGLTVPGNNQTRGQSAYTMTHPGLFNHLDYPDVASLACPKPMLLFNGLRDGLFPVPSVEDAYAKMRKVWESQGAGDRLVTRLWDVPHEFNRDMQEDAFNWLDRQMRPKS